MSALYLFQRIVFWHLSSDHLLSVFLLTLFVWKCSSNFNSQSFVCFLFLRFLLRTRQRFFVIMELMTCASISTFWLLFELVCWIFLKIFTFSVFTQRNQFLTMISQIFCFILLSSEHFQFAHISIVIFSTSNSAFHFFGSFLHKIFHDFQCFKNRILNTWVDISFRLNILILTQKSFQFCCAIDSMSTLNSSLEILHINLCWIRCVIKLLGITSFYLEAQILSGHFAFGVFLCCCCIQTWFLSGLQVPSSHLFGWLSTFYQSQGGKKNKWLLL